MKSTTFEESCKKQGYNPETVIPDVSMFPEKHQKALVAFAKLLIVAEDIKEGKDPDWNNSSERKWFPWFDMEVDENNPSGFRFGDSGCANAHTYAVGGSRLCFSSEEDVEHITEHFLDLYRDIMVIQK